jgi:hypothetical protein
LTNSPLTLLSFDEISMLETALAEEEARRQSERQNSGGRHGNGDASDQDGGRSARNSCEN